MKKILLSALGIAALAVSSANMAKADVITEYTGTSAGGVYNYNVILTGGEELLGGVANQFGTLYNVDGTLGNVTGLLATEFSFATGHFTTPANAQPSITDAPGNSDIRFTFNGAATVTGGDNTVNLGTFTVTGAPAAFVGVATYDGNAYLNSIGTLNGNRGNSIAPSAVPEPVSMSLLGGGLALLGLVRLRRK